MARTKTIPDEDVLEAAGRVFARQGPSRFTLADVAAEVGLAPATIVQRFGSKRALLVAFAEHAADSAAKPFERARRRHREPLAALRAALVECARSQGDRERVVAGLAFFLEDLKDEALRRPAVRHARATEASIRSLLDAAARSSSLAASDTAALARVLKAAFDGALLQWALRGDEPIEAWIDAIFEAVIGQRANSKRSKP